MLEFFGLFIWDIVEWWMLRRRRLPLIVDLLGMILIVVAIALLVYVTLKYL